jgi:glutamine cyclotransferase
MSRKRKKHPVMPKRIASPRHIAWATRLPIVMAILSVALLVSVLAGRALRADAAPVLDAMILHRYPHDASAFTQGLVASGTTLHESTGLYGASTLRRVDLATGVVQKKVSLEPIYFGEGITILGNRIFQLTWKGGMGFVYNIDTFAVEKSFTYKGEGWGLSNDGTHLILSDGSATLRFLDPDTFAVDSTLGVTDGGTNVTSLNELEWVRGEIYANVWHSTRIARIDPETGEVLGWIECSTLAQEAESAASSWSSENVLNGIAYDADAGRLFVTGKRWPLLFEIQPPEPTLGVRGWWK